MQILLLIHGNMTTGKMLAKFCLVLLYFALSEAFNGGNKFEDPTIVSIAGGQVVPPKFAPYIVSLQSVDSRTGRRKFICGGTLIERRWVITAAQCVNDPSLHVITGELRLSTQSGNEQIFKPERIIRNGGFTPRQRPFRNDIAIIKLDRDAEINDFTRTVRMASLNDNIFSTGRCFVAGWGPTQEDGKESDVLMHVEVPVLKNNVCSRAYDTPFVSKFPYLCAGSVEGEKGFCSDDAGGPLVCYAEDGVYEFTGVASYQLGCVRKGFPGIYMKVAIFKDWIESIISQDEAEEEFSVRMGSSNLKALGLFVKRILSS